MKRTIHACATLAVAALTFAPNLAATSIIVARATSAIFIGADSLRMGQTEPVCKINFYGDAYVVAAGPVESPGGFKLHDLLKAAGTVGDTLAEKVVAIDRILQPPVQALLDETRRGDPAKFLEYQSGYFMHIALAKIENGRPASAQIRYRPRVDVEGAISLESHRCPPACDTEDRVFLLGRYVEVRRLLPRTLFPDLTDEEFRDRMDRLIRAEIKAAPDKVGPPINILKIDRDGARWLQRGDSCPPAIAAQQ